MKSKVRELIDAYLITARRITAQMAAAYRVENIWQAYLDRSIPKAGPVLTNGSGTYRFHGVGCQLKLGDVDIEIDFGPEGSVDGFDAYRLNYFALHTLGNDALDTVAIQREIANLHERGELVEKPHCGNSLFCLAVDAMRSAAQSNQAIGR